MNKQQPASPEHNRSRGRAEGNNRERLIAAGYEVLSEKGFQATTVKEISQVAGVSPGLFHYFSSKDELLLAVVREARRQYKERTQRLRASVSKQEFLGAILFANRESVEHNPEWFRLRYELYALGLRSPDFLPAVGELLEDIRDEIVRNVREVVGEDEEKVQALAAVALACFDGLGLQQLAQPEADFTQSYEMVHELFASHQAREE